MAKSKMIKIECGCPPSFCIGCSACGGRGYILADEDYLDIKIGDAVICTGNPARLYLLDHATPAIFLFIPSSLFINGKVRVLFDRVEQLAVLEEILYDSLEHETIHYLLAKMFNMYTSKKLENIHKTILEWIRK
jgi:hypothetical protein